MPQTMTFLGRSFLVANSFLVLSASSVLSQTLPPPPTGSNSQSQNAVEYEFQAPSNSSSPAGNTLFRVQIYGTSERMLSLVRRVEPEAFVPEGEDIIQAGLFSERVRARSLVKELSQQGVQADIIRIQKSQTRSSRETISLASSRESSPNAEENIAGDTSQAQEKRQTERTPRAYYVVIPGNQEQVSRIARRAQEAGVNPDLIQKREAPRGTHVAVGPFKNRKEASRWNQQLQTEGLNRARVYFGR